MDRIEDRHAGAGAGRRRGTRRAAARGGVLLACALLTGCGGGGLFGRGGAPDPERTASARDRALVQRTAAGLERGERETIFDLFRNADDPNTTVEVNRFIWNATLDVLDFLPIEAVDPFTGVIVMGYGVPPGGGTPYRATVYVQDPALDARALSVALATRSGPAPAATQRAVEDAILTRARQLRIATGRL